MTLVSKRLNDQIKYSNRKKTNADFKGKDLRRSNCFNCDFTQSNFDEASFRGAQFKGCNFTQCTFEEAELIAANFKNSSFKNVHFENTVFDTVNLENVNFEGATFKNVIFVATDLSKVVNLELPGESVQVFEEMPLLVLSKELEKAFNTAMKNEFIKYARVLDTKDGKVSTISMMRLLQKFDEEIVIKGLKKSSKTISENFATLSTIIKQAEMLKEEYNL
nr:pentapeptide repeat-containing protein [uncultured Niameybacter sp.]